MTRQSGFRMRFALAGAGRVGQALARLLTDEGHVLVEVASKTPDRARQLAHKYGAAALPTDQLSGKYEWLFITVRDDAIEEVAGQIARAFDRRKAGQDTIQQGQDTIQREGTVRFVAHTSGVHSANALNILRRSDERYVAAIHPAVSIAEEPLAWRVLQEAFFTLDGDAEATSAAANLIHRWGGRYRIINSEHKPIYHAGAVFASNYVWTLFMQALELWEQAGLDEEDSQKALLSLMRSSVDNIARIIESGSQGKPVSQEQLEHRRTPLELVEQCPEGERGKQGDLRRALTGPLARCDQKTLKLHLEHLSKLNLTGGNAHALYCSLGLATANKLWGAADAKTAPNRTASQRDIIAMFRSAAALDHGEITNE